MHFLHLHILSQNPQNPQKLLAEKKKSVSICEIRGRLFSARSFCEFRGFRGRITMLVHECLVGALETSAPPKRVAWVWQGCHTLLQKLPRIARMYTD